MPTKYVKVLQAYCPETIAPPQTTLPTPLSKLTRLQEAWPTSINKLFILTQTMTMTWSWSCWETPVTVIYLPGVTCKFLITIKGSLADTLIKAC